MTDALNPRIYVLTFTAFVMLSSEFIVAGLLPQISSSLHISIGDAGWLVTAFALGMGVSAPLIAAVTQHVSMRHLLIWACLALFLGNAICAFTTYFPLLLAGRALGGVGVAIFWTNAVLTAVALSSSGSKSLAISRVLIGISIASVVGVPLGKWVSDLWTWEHALGLMAALSAVALASVVLWIHPPQSDTRGSSAALSARLKSVLKKDIALALLSYLLMFAGIMTMFSYLATFLAGYSGFSATHVTLILALYGVADIVGNLVLAKRIASPDRAFKRVLITFSVTMLAVSIVGMQLWLVPVVVAALGFQHAGASLLNGMDVVRRSGANAQFINSVNVTAINAGIMFGTTAGGLVVDHVGLQYIGCLGAVFMVLAWYVRTRLAPISSGF